MTLEVRCDNVPAIDLYRKLGYRFVECLPRHYDDGQDGFRLECSLDTPAAPPYRRLICYRRPGKPLKTTIPSAVPGSASSRKSRAAIPFRQD